MELYKCLNFVIATRPSIKEMPNGSFNSTRPVSHHAEDKIVFDIRFMRIEHSTLQHCTYVTTDEVSYLPNNDTSAIIYPTAIK